MEKKLRLKDMRGGGVTFITAGGVANRLLAIWHLYYIASPKRMNIIWDSYQHDGREDDDPWEFNDFFEPLPNVYYYHSFDYDNSAGVPYPLRPIYYSCHPRFRAKTSPCGILLAKIIYKLIFGFKAVTFIARWSVNRHYLSNTNRSQLCRLVSGKNKTVFCCTQMFYRGLSYNPPPFRLRAEYLRKVNEITKHFTPDTVGIHARHYEATEITKDPAYVYATSSSLMDKEISLNPKVKFYLASDNEQTKHRLSERYGERIIACNDYDITRKTTNGIEGAIIDIYALAQTCKIIAVHYSTFAILASQLRRGVPLHTHQREIV